MRRVVLSFSSALLMVSSAATAQTVTTITTTTVSNGTTLPFQRHIIRVGPAAAGQGELVAAIQRQGVGGEGLDLFLSKDDGQTWVESLPVQDDSTERDTADLLADPDGHGFSLLYSLEPVSSGFGVDPRSDVVFLHYAVAGDLSISIDNGPVTVYSPGSNQAYFRCSIARDTTDTLHATATLLDATNGNEFSWWESVSTDEGNSWSAPVLIETFGATEGGGRVNAYGNRLIAIYDDYSVADEGRYRTKAAGASSTWGSEGIVEPLGLYHAGAFSVTSTPDGHVHLGYSDKPEEQLWYREYDGSSWSGATQIESSGVWSNQPALSSIGNTLFYSWNHMVTATDNTIEQVTKPQGGTFSSPTIVDSVPLFKGYTNALEVLTAGESLAVLWSQDPTPPDIVSNVQCGLVSGLADISGGGGAGSDGGPSDAGSGSGDAGSGAPDGGPSDAGSGAPDGGPSDAGSGGSTGGSGSSLTFSDTFASCTSTTSLDSSWTSTGTWYCDAGRARGQSAGGIALADTSTLGNTEVSALVQLDGSSGSGVLARASGDSGYAAVIDVNAGIDIISLNNGVATVLASTNASIADETSYTVGLNVTGTNPVTLQALLNGTVVATATDSSAGAFTAGAAGLLSGANARTQYANFKLTGTTSSASTPPPPPAGLPYSDTFASCTATSGLGSGWTATGTWYCDAGYARGESTAGLALAQLSLPASVTVSARVQLTGVATGSGVVVRASASAFYLAQIEASGSVEIVRFEGSTATSLASVSTGIQAGVFYDVGLTVSGTGPVQLAATINGTTVVSATDSGGALASGSAGLYSGSSARTQFNDFKVTSP